MLILNLLIVIINKINIRMREDLKKETEIVQIEHPPLSWTSREKHSNIERITEEKMRKNLKATFNIIFTFKLKFFWEFYWMVVSRIVFRTGW